MEVCFAVFEVMLFRFLSTDEERQQFCIDMAQFPEDLQYTSFCFGSGMDGDVMEAVQLLLNGIGIDTVFACMPNCECVTRKQRWLLHRHKDDHDSLRLIADMYLSEMVLHLALRTARQS